MDLPPECSRGTSVVTVTQPISRGVDCPYKFASTYYPRKATNCCIIGSLTLLISILLYGSIFASFWQEILFLPYPLQAACKVQWKVSGMECSDVGAKLVLQLTEWQSNNTCSGARNEGCMYKILHLTETTVHATHTTAVGNFTDDLHFQFLSGPSNCTVLASSKSRAWPLFYDYGLNYCNLRNLARGAGLMEKTKFDEVTSDRKCTQYSQAICKVH